MPQIKPIETIYVSEEEAINGLNFLSMDRNDAITVPVFNFKDDADLLKHVANTAIAAYEQYKDTKKNSIYIHIIRVRDTRRAGIVAYHKKLHLV